MSYLDKDGLSHAFTKLKALINSNNKEMNAKLETKLGAVSENGFYGMAKPDGTNSDWIRTTSNGIIPYQSGGASSLGTEVWPFNNAYINIVHGSLDGNAKSATSATSATTASKLATAITIGVGTAVTSTAQSFNGESNITIPINSVKESYLDWGGKSVQGSISPVGTALSAEHSANRLAFINGNALTMEYSSDGGSTWTDYGYSAETKSQFCTTNVGIPIGRASASSNYTTSSRTRITINAQPYVYTNPKKMLINMSASGQMKVLVEYKTGVSGASWQTYGTYNLTGWSGWNDIPLILSTLGGNENQTSNNRYLRLTFIMESVDSNYPTVASVSGIRLFGPDNWICASENNNKGVMSYTGHLYSYDMNANATFPAQVTATQFNGTATRANKLSATQKGNATQPVYISSDGVPTATTYTLGKSVPADAKFTDTNTWRGIQDNLTSTSTTDSLSAAQGKILNDKFSFYVPTARTVNGKALSANISLTASDVGASASGHNHDGTYLKLSGGAMTGASSVTTSTVPSGLELTAHTRYVDSSTNKEISIGIGSGHNNRGLYDDANSKWLVYFDANNNGYLNGKATSATTADSASAVAWANVTGKPSTYAPSSHNHDGTYVPTTEAGTNAALNRLSTGSSIPVDNDYFISQYVDGGTTTTTYHRRPVSALWSYIKGKTDVLYQAKGSYAAASHSHSAATTSADGFMSSGDKTKLNGIATGANNYSLPTATSSILGGVKVGGNITLSSGTISLTKTNVTSALGYTPPTTNTTYSVATASANGLMPSTDKAKLDALGGIVSIQKSLTLKTDWQNTGIASDNLSTGTYVVQVSGLASDDGLSTYSEIWSGVMSWYGSGTNSTESDEIFLHKAGHAPNGNDIYLRTMRNSSGTLALQIAATANASKADAITFKFRKLI